MYFCSQIVKCHHAMIQIPIESMNLMMLNVGYATHHADWNWQKASSPFIRIFYIMEGEAMPANVATVTKTYFIRLFKQEFAQTPVQYINRKKVERAQLMLFTSDCSVKEVAYKLGFSDYGYFIRLFRKMTGITPQEYRRKLRV